MPLTQKQRPLPFMIESADYGGLNYPGGNPFSEHASPQQVNGIQITESEGHFRPKGKSSLADGDIGGDFFTMKRHIVGTSSPIKFAGVTNYVNGIQDVHGTIQWFPIAPGLASFPPAASSSEDELDEVGATAISRCKPTKSTASFATALGELFKDGLPHAVGSTLWKDQAHNIRRNAGDEFLNVQFGWEPLLHDIRSFAGGVKNADKLTRQYVRDAGRPVRRDYRFPTTYTASDEIEVPGDLLSVGEYLNPYNSKMFDGAGPRRCYYVDYTTVQRWFEGVFTYALPSGITSVMGKRAGAATQILGVIPDPETLWNLAPWSWAVDWFSNTGDVISNVNDWATDGLVMRYGYVMEHSMVKRIYYNKESGFLGSAGRYAPELVFITEVKQRRRANPFGFGVSWTGLSPIQTAIVAALGLSRS